MSEEINHPDIEWAKAIVREAKGDRVSEEELDTLRWYGPDDPARGGYSGMYWARMFLGIETDGDMPT